MGKNENKISNAHRLKVPGESYNLYCTERKYREDTLLSYYYQPTRKIVKTSAPVEVNGERMKHDFLTGKMRYYKKQEVMHNHQVSVEHTKILLVSLLEMNDFDWFCTLTFDKERIDRADDKAVYACYQKYINNLSHQFPDMRYVCVLERHQAQVDEDCGCIHFHLVIGGVPASALGLVNTGKVCCSWATKLKRGKRVPIKYCARSYYEKTKHLHINKPTDGEPVYNVTSFAYGLTTASKIVSRERCMMYMQKYIEKDVGNSTSEFKKRFYYSHNLRTPAKVKKLIGAGFSYPENIRDNYLIRSSDLYKNRVGKVYISDHNTMQFRVDNTVKDNLELGLKPITETVEFPLDIVQIGIEDEIF